VPLDGDLEAAYSVLDEKGRVQLANAVLELSALVPLDGDSIAASTSGFYVTQEELFNKPLYFFLRYPNSGFPLLLENPETPDLGHWVLLWMWSRRTVEIFDPTGMPISNSVDRYLQRNGICCIVYNDLGLQKIDNAIQTCGKWVIYRYRSISEDRMTYDQFIKHLKQISGNDFSRLDHMICAITDVTIVK
jgi:hypothetical protein